MGQYDPLGLAAPLSLRAKLLLRRSHAAAKSWSKELPKDIKKEWGGLIGELQEAGTTLFPRSVVPDSAATSRPVLIGFGDGSSVRYAATVYVVWPRSEGHAVVNLVIAKSRVVPAA